MDRGSLKTSGKDILVSSRPKVVFRNFKIFRGLSGLGGILVRLVTVLFILDLFS